jgi:hypothetical protein
MALITFKIPVLHATASRARERSASYANRAALSTVEACGRAPKTLHKRNSAIAIGSVRTKPVIGHELFVAMRHKLWRHRVGTDGANTNLAIVLRG